MRSPKASGNRVSGQGRGSKRSGAVIFLVWSGCAANAMRCWPGRRRRTGVRLAAERCWSGQTQFPIRRIQQQLKWIIAASYCRGGTLWAGLLRRSSLPITHQFRGQRLQPALPAVRRRSRNDPLSTPARRRRAASRACERRALGQTAAPTECWTPKRPQAVQFGSRFLACDPVQSGARRHWHRLPISPREIHSDESH